MEIKENVSLAPLTTFKIGGVAMYFCVAKNQNDVQQAILFSKEKKLPIFILGGGSNVLISDHGFNGLVIKNEIFGIKYTEDVDSVIVEVGAGEVWDDLVSSTVVKGLSGIENLSGIPGLVGAAPVQNIGAYGSEIKDCVTFVETVNLKDGDYKIFSNDECKFSYRDSFFKSEAGKNYIITKVTLKLSKNASPNISYKDLKEHFTKIGNDKPNPKEIRETVLSIRAGKMPDFQKLGTAGSFFKNPIITKTHFEELKNKFPLLPGHDVGENLVKVPLAWILDNVCALKGYNKGFVGLYEKQPLVVVTKKGATTNAVLSLAKEIEEEVFKKTKIKIEKEVCII